MVDGNNDEAWRLSSLAQLGSVTWLGLAAQQLGCLYLAGWLVGLAQLVSSARLGLETWPTRCSSVGEWTVRAAVVVSRVK